MPHLLLRESALRDDLERLLADLLKKKHIRQAILSVESGDRSFSWTGAVGEADPAGRPMTVETPFFIASVDKLFIATIILKLHERGRIRLEAPMESYLPVSLTRGLHRHRGVDHTGKITLRHLLGHSSGLPDYLEDYPRGGPSLLVELERDGDIDLEIADVTRRVREKLTPHFPPQPIDASRVRIRYSDTNYALLIAIIERMTERTLEEVYAEEIFGPLEMNDTFTMGKASPEPAVQPATLWSGREPLGLPRVMRSLHSVYSTPRDMIEFLRALLAGRLFESPSTAGLMQERWNRFGVPRDRGALRAPGWPIEYGLGMMRFRLPPLFAAGRRLPAVIGHTGSTGSWLFHCPEYDIFICGDVSQVTAGAVPYRVVPKLLRAVQQRSGDRPS